MLFSLVSGVAGDPASSRTVYAIVIGLLVIGLVLVGLGIWVIRQTRVDPELLAPLEVMDGRSWRKRDPAGRRRLLDDVRPAGAEPVHRTPTEPEVDSDFDRSERRVPSFLDLEPVKSHEGSSPAEESVDPVESSFAEELDEPVDPVEADQPDEPVEPVVTSPAEDGAAITLDDGSGDVDPAPDGTPPAAGDHDQLPTGEPSRGR